MLYVLSVFIFIVEIVSFVLLIKRVFKFHQLSLKDTFVYPVIVVIVTVVILCLEQLPNTNFWKNLVSALSRSVDIVKLTLDNAYAEKFKDFALDKQFLIINYYFSYIISATALFSLSVSLLKATVKNLCARFYKFFLKERTIVFGFNEDAKNFIRGLEFDKRKYVLVILDSSILNKYVDEKLFLEKYKISYKLLPYKNTTEIKASLEKLLFNKKNFLLRFLKWLSTKDYNINVITFFDLDSININFVSSLKQILHEEDCYGGFSYSKIDSKRIYEGQIYCIKLHDTKNGIKVGNDKLLAYNEWENAFVFKCDSVNDNEISVLDEKKENISLFSIDISQFGKVNLKKSKVLSMNGCDFDVYIINYKKPKKFYFNICCNSVQQELLEKIICNPIIGDNGEAIDGSLKMYPNVDENLFVTDFSRGMIKTFNKYDIISLDFIKHNSFARFIEKDDIYENCTLKNCDINLYVLGYGNVNQPLLRDILINNQFVERVYNNSSYGLSSKRINVKIYDKKRMIEDSSFSVGFLKYNKDKLNKDKYFDLPENYITESNFNMNQSTNNYEFVKDIYDKVRDSSLKSGKQYNFFLISLDTDSLNWEVASILEENCTKYNSKNIFFIRTKNYNYLYGNIDYFKNKNMIGFGVEEYDTLGKNTTNSEFKFVFSYENIINNDIREFAMKNHFMYEEKVINDAAPKDILNYSYSLLPRIKQLSNIYSTFGLYSKLSLMKLSGDYKHQFLNMTEVVKDENNNYNINSWVETKLDFTTSEVMAFIEKERWNAFEIGYGLLPMKKENIKKINGKFIKENGIYHGCICSQKGIIDFYNKYKKDYVIYDYGIINFLHENPKLLDNYKDFITDK